MTNTDSVLLQFIIFRDKQAKTTSFARTHTHTHTHRAESGSKLVPDFSSSEAWTRAVSQKPRLNLNRDWVRATPVPGKPKPELEPTQNLVRPQILHRVFTLAPVLALNYKCFGGKSGEGSHQQRSGSPVTLPQHAEGNGSRYTKRLPAFPRPGPACSCCRPQHLFQNSSLPFSPPSFQNLLGWGRGLELLGGLAAIVVPQLVK